MIEQFCNCLSKFSSLLRKFANLILDRIQLHLLNAVYGLLLFLLLDGVGSKRLKFTLCITNPAIEGQKWFHC